MRFKKKCNFPAILNSYYTHLGCPYSELYDDGCQYACDAEYVSNAKHFDAENTSIIKCKTSDNTCTMIKLTFGQSTFHHIPKNDFNIQQLCNLENQSCEPQCAGKNVMITCVDNKLKIVPSETKITESAKPEPDSGVCSSFCLLMSMAVKFKIPDFIAITRPWWWMAKIALSSVWENSITPTILMQPLCAIKVWGVRFWGLEDRAQRWRLQCNFLHCNNRP